MVSPHLGQLTDFLYDGKKCKYVKPWKIYWQNQYRSWHIFKESNLAISITNFTIISQFKPYMTEIRVEKPFTQKGEYSMYFS